MGNTYVLIDEQNWKRAMHCKVFRDCVEPAFCVSFELDITNFLQKIREKHYSFTFAMIYSVTVCANQIEEFRYRFLDGKVVSMIRSIRLLPILIKKQSCSRW